MRGVCVAAVVAAALGHVNDLPSRACAQSLWLFLQYLGFVTVGGFEHLANRYLQDRSNSARRNRFSLRLLYRVELSGSNGNDFGAFEHARS